MPYTRADIGKSVAPHVPQPFHIEPSISHTHYDKCPDCSIETYAERQYGRYATEPGDKGSGLMQCKKCRGKQTLPAGICPVCDGVGDVPCTRCDGTGEIESVLVTSK